MNTHEPSNIIKGYANECSFAKAWMLALTAVFMWLLLDISIPELLKLCTNTECTKVSGVPAVVNTWSFCWANKVTAGKRSN